MITDYLRIVIGNLRYRQRRSILTMIGIFIGIAAVVGLISLGQGMQDAINAQFASVGGDKLIIQSKGTGMGPPGSTSSGKITDKDLEQVRRIGGIQEVAGRLLKTATLRFNNQQRIQFITSIPNSNDANLVIEANRLTAAQGRLLKPTDKGKINIGAGLADKTIFGQRIEVGNKIDINGKDFQVVGVLGQLGDPARNKAVVMNQDDARALFDIKDEELSIIVARVAPGESPPKLAEDVKRELRRFRHEKEGRETIDVQTSDQLIRSFNTILNIVQAVLVGIAMISLLVGGIGIMNTMYTAVMERTREIGTMKAVGARNIDITMIFLMEAGILGAVGGLIGVGIGFSMSKAVELLAQLAWGPGLLKASYPPILFVGAFGFSFIIGVLSGVIPALRAAKLAPVEALRYE